LVLPLTFSSFSISFSSFNFPFKFSSVYLVNLLCFSDDVVYVFHLFLFAYSKWFSRVFQLLSY
jgi:hypothetical protein